MIKTLARFVAASVGAALSLFAADPPPIAGGTQSVRVTDVGQIVTPPNFIGTIPINGVTYTLPAADGAAGDGLVTDGAGGLSFSPVGAAAANFLIPVSTFADLASTAPTGVRTNAWLSGFTEAGDGGQGVFYYTAALPAWIAAPDGNNASVASGGGYWVRSRADNEVTVNTLAEVANVRRSGNVVRVNTRGFAFPDDGGGSTYHYVTNVTAANAPNNYALTNLAVIPVLGEYGVGGLTNVWVDDDVLKRSVFNVRRFGARPFVYTVDQVPAFQAAWDAAAKYASNRVGTTLGRRPTVYIPAGVYEWRSTWNCLPANGARNLMNSPSIKGDDMGSTVLYGANISSGAIMIYVQNFQGIVIEGLSLFGLPDTTPPEPYANIGLFMDEGSHATVRNCQFYYLGIGTVISSTVNNWAHYGPVFYGVCNIGIFGQAMKAGNYESYFESCTTSLLGGGNGVNLVTHNQGNSTKSETISQVTRTSNVATITTLTPHGFPDGRIVTITGVATAGFNATNVVATVTDSTHFTYANTGADVGLTASSGTAYLGLGQHPAMFDLNSAQNWTIGYGYEEQNTGVNVLAMGVPHTNVVTMSAVGAAVTATFTDRHKLGTGDVVTISSDSVDADIVSGIHGSHTITSSAFTNTVTFTASNVITTPLTGKVFTVVRPVLDSLYCRNIDVSGSVRGRILLGKVENARLTIDVTANTNMVSMTTNTINPVITHNSDPTFTRVNDARDSILPANAFPDPDFVNSTNSLLQQLTYLGTVRALWATNSFHDDGSGSIRSLIATNATGTGRSILQLPFKATRDAVVGKPVFLSVMAMAHSNAAYVPLTIAVVSPGTSGYTDGAAAITVNGMTLYFRINTTGGQIDIANYDRTTTNLYSFGYTDLADTANTFTVAQAGSSGDATVQVTAWTDVSWWTAGTTRTWTVGIGSTSNINLPEEWSITQISYAPGKWIRFCGFLPSFPSLTANTIYLRMESTMPSGIKATGAEYFYIDNVVVSPVRDAQEAEQLRRGFWKPEVPMMTKFMSRTGRTYTTPIPGDGFATLFADDTSGTTTLWAANEAGTTLNLMDADLVTWSGVTPGAGVATWIATPSSANLSTAVTGETGSGALMFGTSPTITTSVDHGAAGVRISDDGDGALTFLGIGDGAADNDEALTFNFEDTANTVSVSSSTGVTTVDFGSITLGATALDISGSGAGLLLLGDTDGSNYGGIKPNGTTTTDTILELPAAPFTGLLKSTIGSVTNMVVSAASAGTDYTSPSSTESFTNKTLDSSATGNVLKQTKYIVLVAPQICDGTGAIIYTNAYNVVYYGQAKFSNSADKAANYIEYRLTVPEDVDTAVDMTVARWKFRLNGADTGTHRYEISMASVADSASYAGSVGNAVNLDFAGDASGADGDVETKAGVTLTNWKSNVTAGQLWVIRVARDGDAAEDASTVDSYSGPLVISYGSTQ